MKKSIEICRQDEIAAALAALDAGHRGEALLRRAQDLVWGCDAAALACAGGHCWMELHDVIGKGPTLEAAIRAWCDAARAAISEAA